MKITSPPTAITEGEVSGGDDPRGDLTGAVQTRPGVITPGQSRESSVGTFRQIACHFDGKWVEILWNRQAKGDGWPPLS